MESFVAEARDKRYLYEGFVTRFVVVERFVHSEVTKMDKLLRSESVDFDWLEGFGAELEDRGWLVNQG